MEHILLTIGAIVLFGCSILAAIGAAASIVAPVTYKVKIGKTETTHIAPIWFKILLSAWFVLWAAIWWVCATNLWSI